MKFSVKVILIAAALAATGAYAKGERTDPNAIARAQTMGGRRRRDESAGRHGRGRGGL